MLSPDHIHEFAHSPAVAGAIEDAIGESGHVIYSHVEKESRLRLPVCGMASTAIADFLVYQGQPAELLQSTSSPHPTIEQLEHVVVRVGDTIIDPTYSQFLSFVGLDRRNVYYKGVNQYPEQKIAVFPIDQPDQVVATMVAAMQGLHRRRHPNGASIDQIQGLTPRKFATLLRGIWDPAAYQPFVPSENTARVAAVATDKMRQMVTLPADAR